MPSFEWAKYLTIVLAIGVMAGGLMWGYDKFAAGFNALIGTGNVSHIGVQSMTVLYWAIVCFAPINLFFWSAHCILVGNARTEPGSGFITSNPMGHIILFCIIIAAYLVNFGVCSVGDPTIIGLNGLHDVNGTSLVQQALTNFGVTGSMSVIFSSFHLLSCLAVGIAYLYMIYLSVSIESMQYGGQI